MPPDFDQQAREIVRAYCDHAVTPGSRFDLHDSIARALHAAYRAGLDENNLKARQYDSVAEAVNPADGGRYRADTIAALLGRLRDAERRERESYRAGLAHAAQLADECGYGKEAAGKIREEIASCHK